MNRPTTGLHPFWRDAMPREDEEILRLLEGLIYGAPGEEVTLTYSLGTDEDDRRILGTGDPVAEYQKLYDQLRDAQARMQTGAVTMVADVVPATYFGSRAAKARRAAAATPATALGRDPADSLLEVEKEIKAMFKDMDKLPKKERAKAYQSFARDPNKQKMLADKLDKFNSLNEELLAQGVVPGTRSLFWPTSDSRIPLPQTKAEYDKMFRNAGVTESYGGRMHPLMQLVLDHGEPTKAVREIIEERMKQEMKMPYGGSMQTKSLAYSMPSREGMLPPTYMDPHGTHPKMKPHIAKGAPAIVEPLISGDDIIDAAIGAGEFGLSMLPFVGGAYEAASGYSDMGDIEGQMEALYQKATPGQRAMMDEYTGSKEKERMDIEKHYLRHMLE